MGCCLSRDQSSMADSEELEGGMTLGKSRPLLQERLKWKSDVPITEGQLRSKRDEFWETAPAFEGRKEIWDALRAASAQAEAGDWAMAQAILDGACVCLPDGTLRESYDELGNRYQVPIYCLFSPVNLVESKSESSIASNGAADPTPIPLSTSPPSGGKPVTLKLRLSSSAEGTADLPMEAKTTESVASVKRRLIALHTGTLPPDPHDQRWYYGGRYLRDKATVEECSIPTGFVVQVIVRTPEDCPVFSTAAPVPKAKEHKRKRKSKSKSGQASSSQAASSSTDKDRTTTDKDRNEKATEKEKTEKERTETKGSKSSTSKSSKPGHPSAAAVLQPPNTEEGEAKARPRTKESGASLQLSSLSSTSNNGDRKEPPPIE